MCKMYYAALGCRHFPVMQYEFCTFPYRDVGGAPNAKRVYQGGPVKLDSMWQHRLTRPLHVQHTYYRIIFKQNPFNIISRGVQG